MKAGLFLSVSTQLVTVVVLAVGCSQRTSGVVSGATDNSIPRMFFGLHIPGYR